MLPRGSRAPRPLARCSGGRRSRGSVLPTAATAVTRILIRCDASLSIGSGHVIRCRSLARELHRRGAEVSFLCRRQPDDLINLLEPEIADVAQSFGAIVPFIRPAELADDFAGTIPVVAHALQWCLRENLPFNGLFKLIQSSEEHR